MNLVQYRRIIPLKLSWKNFIFASTVTHQWGGGPPTHLGLKKSEKMRFFKSCDTLTTIQLREKTQLTKVVSPLKRFGGPLQTRWDNRNFWLKKQLKTALWRPPRPWVASRELFFEAKIAIRTIQLRCPPWRQFFPKIRGGGIWVWKVSLQIL